MSRRFTFLATLSIAFALSGALLGAFYTISFDFTNSFALRSYWATTELFWTGGNPYDPQAVLSIHKSATGIPSPLELVWGMPAIFIFTGISSLMSLDSYLSFQWKFSILLYALSCAILVFNFQGRGRSPPQDIDRFSDAITLLEVMCLVTFYPLYTALLLNPIATTLLFSVSLFFALLHSPTPSKRREFIAGAMLSIAIIKPQTLYLLFTVVLASLISKSRRTVALGFVTGGIIVGIIPLLVNSVIYEHYRTATLTFPIGYFTPTIGAWLRALFLPTSAFVLFIPPLVVAAIALGYSLFKAAHSNAKSFFHPLWIPLSIATTAYSWGTDWIVLAPAIIWIYEKLRESGAFEPTLRFRALLLALTLPALNVLLFLGPTDFRYGLWYPFAIGFCVLYSMRIQGTVNVES